ncbi:MAG: SH3 domain-containing protein [Bacteroidota bacterium]
MEKKGRFILMNIAEFEEWLMQNHFSRVIKLIQNHHTYIPNYSHFKSINHFGLLQGMENSHLQRGFSEIAQNITTFPDGKIAVCRSFDKIPAGIKGANQYGIYIDNLGNFDTGGDTMSVEQKLTIVKANALLATKFGLTPTTDTLVYHHWYDLNSGLRTGGSGVTKSCPGTNFFGGNTVNDAKQIFIPLILAAMQNPDVVPPVEEVLGTYEVTTYGLNVRSGPGVDNPVMKVLRKGTVVHVYEEEINWCRIHKTEALWVSRNYLKAV